MNKPANVKRTTAMIELNERFSRIVASYPTVKDIPANTGYQLAERIEELAALSSSKRWIQAVYEWSRFMREEIHARNDSTHYAFVQGIIDFGHATAGLVNDDD